MASYAPSLYILRGPLIRRLKALGHDVFCAAPEINQNVRGKLRELGTDVYEIPLQRKGLNPIADLQTFLALRHLFGFARPDIVLAYTAKPVIYASLAARHAHVSRIVPMLTGLGGVYLQNISFKNRLLRPVMNTLYRAAFSGADAIIFHNDDDRAHLASIRTLPKFRPTYVVNGSGVDLQEFPRQPLPSINGGLTFLMIARLVHGKGILEYCRAAQSLKARWPNARWCLVGPEETGANGLSLEDLQAFKDFVDYLGPAGDVRPALGNCHVYVLPSYGEGMPKTVLEALATGRPVITTNTAGCRETVVPGRNGIVVPPRDADALAQAMERFLKEPRQLRAMAAESRRIAHEKFDVDLVNNEMMRALGI